MIAVALERHAQHDPPRSASTTSTRVCAAIGTDCRVASVSRSTSHRVSLIGPPPPGRTRRGTLAPPRCEVVAEHGPEIPSDEACDPDTTQADAASEYNGEQASGTVGSNTHDDSP